MITDLLLTAFEQTLLLLPLICGLYVTYRLLKITDLTVEGSYVFGAANCVAVYEQTNSFLLAIVSMMIGAVLIAIFISLMHRRYPGKELMIGILGTFMMYSINLIVMKRPYIPIDDRLSSIEFLGEYSKIISISLISLSMILIFYLLIESSFGLVLRGIGSNHYLMSRLGYPVLLLKTGALIITHIFSATSGALTALSYNFADIHMGSGIALTSLGAMIIGLSFSKQILLKMKKNYHVGIDLVGCFLGCFFYFLLMGLLLFIGLPASFLKLAIGAILLLTLGKGA